MDRTKNIYLPRWVTILYTLLGLALIPWIFNLAVNLPSRHIAHHWDALWVGFDILMLIALVITIIFVIRRSVWVAISGTALATLFIVDVWFDVLTARPGHEQRVAIFFGAMEIILAALTYRLVLHVVHKSTPNKNVRLVTKNEND